MTFKDDSFKDNLILINRSLWYLSFHRQRLYFSRGVEVKLIRSSNCRGLCTVKSHHRITTILSLFINDRFKRPHVTKGQIVASLMLECVYDLNESYFDHGKLHEEKLLHIQTNLTP